MPSKRMRRLIVAAIALVLLQAVLPGLHVLVDHCQPAGMATAVPLAQPTGAGDHDDCPLCAFLHVAGHAVPPAADTAPAVEPRPECRVAPPPKAILQPPPDVRCSSSRGPPTA